MVAAIHFNMDDWEALVIDGKLIDQNHSINWRHANKTMVASKVDNYYSLPTDDPDVVRILRDAGFKRYMGNINWGSDDEAKASYVMNWFPNEYESEEWSKLVEIAKEYGE